MRVIESLLRILCPLHRVRDLMIGTISVSDEPIEELESSNIVVVGTLMDNFTVPSALKAWIDLIVRPAGRSIRRRKERSGRYAIVRSSLPWRRAVRDPTR